jgi:putative phosphoesterase
VLVAVVSDTHLPRGSRRLPDACVERMRAADLILHGGDVATVAALEELRALGPPVHAVAGNVDEPALQAELPPELVVEVGQVKIAMTHIPGPARGREQRLRARFPSADAIVYGHTHMPQVDELGGVWILNPGSPTERRRAPARTMIVLEIRRRKVRPELLVVG